MKTNVSLLSFILMSFLFINQIDAQTNAPNKEDIKVLVDHMDYCNAIKTALKGKVFYLRVNQESITDLEYQETQNEIESAKQCIANAKTEVTKLKETYPNWFESPMASLVVGKKVYTPSWIGYQVAVIVGSYRPIFQAFDGIKHRTRG